MKTKIASFLTAAVLSVMALATTSFADSESGFYDKEHIRGFISIGADYRGMRSAFQDYVNSLAFSRGVYLEDAAAGDSSGAQVEYVGKPLSNLGYKKFDDYYLGLHFNFGAQYKQFLTWIDVNFMPTQISEPSSSYDTATSEDGDTRKYPIHDVKWYAYGADWMFGWKLFGESTPINLIPAVGFGFNLLNIHFGANYDILNDEGSYTHLRNRYYSTMATTVNSEIEVRVELGHLAIGGYAGYRFIRYNELSAEGTNVINQKVDTDNSGDTYFFGLRLTWIFNSAWQTKQESKL